MLKHLKTNKRGVSAAATAAIIAFVVLVVSAVIGAAVVNNVRDTQTSNSFSYNVATDGLTAFDNYSNLLPVVGIVLVAALIIGLLLGAFRFG